MEGTQKEIERVRDRADRVRLLVGLFAFIGVALGIGLTAYKADGCEVDSGQCLVHPYLGAGLALIMVSVLIGLLTWFASIVLEAVLDGRSERLAVPPAD